MITIIIETVKTGFASVSDVQEARVWPKKQRPRGDNGAGQRHPQAFREKAAS
ncbi:hypothetical protein GNP93_11455 [Paenibacillus validus]|uniref:Uncharacterized protein n=1 Tax=Paenibacillus validus TaxID=44253 RepID=A0A7X2ZBY0_9BACL|nr:hypothetical protein [Paenibacillus validus]